MRLAALVMVVGVVVTDVGADPADHGPGGALTPDGDVDGDPTAPRVWETYEKDLAAEPQRTLKLPDGFLMGSDVRLPD